MLAKDFILNIGIEYKLKGFIICPFKYHYATIIFSLIGNLINSAFIAIYIYIHDSLKNNGSIKDIDNLEFWKNIGFPYIAIYYKN